MGWVKEADAALGKRAKNASRGTAAGEGQQWLRLPGLVRAALDETVIGAGLAGVKEVLEAERVARCGARSAQLAAGQARRAGHAVSALVLGGRRGAVRRPRVCGVAGGALQLPSWREWRARAPLEARAVAQLVLGVATRR